MPKALAKPKSANFNSPVFKGWEKNQKTYGFIMFHYVCS